MNNKDQEITFRLLTEWFNKNRQYFNKKYFTANNPIYNLIREELIKIDKWNKKRSHKQKNINNNSLNNLKKDKEVKVIAPETPKVEESVIDDDDWGVPDPNYKDPWDDYIPVGKLQAEKIPPGDHVLLWQLETLSTNKPELKTEEEINNIINILEKDNVYIEKRIMANAHGFIQHLHYVEQENAKFKLEQEQKELEKAKALL